MKKNYLFIIIVGLVGVLLLIPSVRKNIAAVFIPMETIEESVTISEEVLDIELKGINVPSTNLNTLRKDHALFLNFWGTWCPPCREEWPSIEKLYAKKKGTTKFALIAMLDKEDEVRKFIKENKYTAPVYIAQSPLSDEILPKVFPTTFILDVDGRIMKKVKYSTDWDTDEIHELLDKANGFD